MFLLGLGMNCDIHIFEKYFCYDPKHNPINCMFETPLCLSKRLII